MKNSFVMYTDYLKQTEMLTDEQMGILFRAILEYVSGGEPGEMDPLTQMAFNFIKVKIDRDCEKYEETCEKRREAGRKGGIERAKRAQANQANASKAKQIKQNQANQADNDNDNENDNENENDNDNENDTNINVGNNTPLNPPKGKADQMVDAFKRFLPDYNFSPGLISSIEEWCTYKIEKKQPYTETGVKSFLKQIDKQWKAHGESAVIDIIDQTMASGYQGITWDRISKVKPVESTADRVRKVDDWI